jgi:phosphate transport system ATP-binding protein
VREVTIVVVTHNMFQATRVSDQAAVFLLGFLSGNDRFGELGTTATVFRSPDGLRMKEHVTGHVG